VRLFFEWMIGRVLEVIDFSEMQAAVVGRVVIPRFEWSFPSTGTLGLVRDVIGFLVVDLFDAGLMFHSGHIASEYTAP
jgi:hypothetical protein